MQEYLGLFGALLILVGYFGIQLQYFSHDNIYYDLINFFGSLILIYYAVITDSPPFIVLNSVWLIIAIKDIYTFFYKKPCEK